MKNNILNFSLIFLIFLPTLLFAQAKTGINTTDPQATLDVNGNLIVRTPEVLNATNTKSLYIDSNGLVGVLPTNTTTISTPIFYAQGEVTNIVSTNAGQTTAFNAGNTNYIVFKTEDIKYNKIGVKVVGGTYEIGESGIYTIASSVNTYFLTANAGVEIFVMMGIRKRASTTSNWETLLGTRPIIRMTLANQNTPIILPTINTYLERGTQLQFYFERSQYTGGGVQGAAITGVSIQSAYNTPGFSLSLLKL
ncbi:hypothetical protein [Myroides odoratus]|uniref:TNF family profile domain-containing protein n=1 Tax=Myroides odoratus TaxID=256 RepID=A0A378RL64_MYROD|nr:hypothetical protein [Myroides odoratus]QQU05064.1 hypothetical protein I6I89_07225 [Myroides odoratus]STZ27458.1 Uncharacterised protein [Myroides odoratus]